MEWKEIKEVIDFGARLIYVVSSEEFNKISKIIVEGAAEIARADRVCLMLLKQNKLYIEGGFPSEGHGIGKKITSDIGEKFLKGVIDSQTIVCVQHPEVDARTAYMKEMIKTYQIASILFVPLYKEEEPIGIIVFDFSENCQRFNKDYLVKIRFLANFIATALLAWQKRKKEEEKIKRNEKVCALGENSLRVAHTIRNNLTVIGGFSRRLLRKISVPIEEIDFDKLKEIVENITASVAKLEKIVSDVLFFSKIPKINPSFSCLNEFLEREIKKIVLSDVYRGMKFYQRFDKRLNEVTVLFDEKFLTLCIEDIVRNAYEAGARKIWIRTVANFKHNNISIFIANNGEKIDETMKEEIFSPFMTTKSDGTGLGLANVKNIIVAHGGNIRLTEKNKTEFQIEIPLKTKNEVFA